MYSNIHSSFLLNGQKLKIIQMFFNWCMGKQTLPLLLWKQLHNHQIPIQGSITSNNAINKNVSITILGWRKEYKSQLTKAWNQK